MFNEIKINAEKAVSHWVSGYSAIIKIGIAEDTNINKIELSFESLKNRLQSILELCKSLQAKDNNNNHLINTQTLKSINQQINVIEKAGEQLKTFASQVSSFGGFTTFNEVNLHITCKNGNAINIDQPITQTQNALNTILSHISSLTPFIKLSGGLDLQDKLKSLDINIDELSKIKTEIDKIFSEVDATRLNIVALAEKMADKTATSTKHIDDIIKDLKLKQTESTTINSEIQSKLSQVKEIIASSAALNQQVTEYSANFEAFKNAMQDRLKFFDNATKSHNELEAKLKKASEDIENLTEKSNELLAGATKVGLAKSFSDKFDSYQSEVKNSLHAFVYSIIFLLITSLPLAFYVLKINIEYLGINGDGVISIGGILSRVILLLPATWLTTFNSKRYHELFNLREIYSHKATLAQSIHGFKIEAPKYQEEMTAGIFLELNEKPEYGDKLRSLHVKSPNKILSLLIDKVQSVFSPSKG